MWWVIGGVLYALLILFVLAACRVAGRADDAMEARRRRLEREDAQRCRDQQAIREAYESECG